MNRKFHANAKATSMIALVASILAMGGLNAQAQGGRPGDERGRPEGRPGLPPPNMGRNINALHVPIEALTAALKLTPEQAKQIARIQQQARPNGGRRPDGPPQGGGRPEGPGGFGQDGPPPPPQDGGRPEGPGGFGQDGPPPPPQGGGRPEGPGGFGQEGPPPQGGGRPGFGGQAQESKALKSIEAILTAAQRKALPNVLNEIRALGAVGIPPHLYGELKLSAEQKAKLIEIAEQNRPPAPERGERPRPQDPEARRKAHEDAIQKAMDVLTEEQKAKVEAFQREHPRPEPGRGGQDHGGRRGGGRPMRDNN